MVGQNGVGKSGKSQNILVLLSESLTSGEFSLDARSWKQHTGLPQNVRILHIAQLAGFSPGRTILQESRHCWCSSELLRNPLALLASLFVHEVGEPRLNSG